MRRFRTAVDESVWGAEAIKMRMNSEKSNLENELNQLTPDNLMRVWDAATEAEKLFKPHKK